MVWMKPQVWVHNEEPAPEKVEPIRRAEAAAPKKPDGGLWTSPAKEAPDGSVTSPWIEWMQAERYCPVEDPEAWLLTPTDDVQVYTIDSEEDAAEIMEPDPAYEDLPVSSSFGYEIAWERVFDEEGYDAIELTAEGQRATRFPDDRRYSLYGWDAACVLFDGWHFEEVEYLGEVSLDLPTEGDYDG